MIYQKTPASRKIGGAFLASNYPPDAAAFAMARPRVGSPKNRIATPVEPRAEAFSPTSSAAIDARGWAR